MSVATTLGGPLIVDLFAGPGGWDEGLRMIGRTDVLGIEWDESACLTAEAAGHRRLRADVSALNPRDCIGAEGLIASPQCQAWSLAGKRGGEEDRAACHELADRCGGDRVSLTHGSLFTGYGGLDLAVNAAFGSETIWTSDINPGASRIIASRFPGVPNLGDITQVDWSTVRRPSILSGGSPCQDLSTAGARAGMVDGTRSNLWVAMREAIAHLEPTYVVWENVRGALSARAESNLGWTEGLLDGRPQEALPKKEDPALRALGRVLGDLADLGYDARWVCLRASDVGACHRRERVFVLAHPKGHPWRQRVGDPRPARLTAPRRLLPTPTANLGRNGGGQDAEKRRAGGHAVSIEDVAGSLPKLLPAPRASDGPHGGPDSRGSKGDLALPAAACRDFGEYGEAIARHEQTFGHAAPSPTELGKRCAPRLAARFAEWMMCLPDGWVTDPAIWEGMTDTAARNAQLHALGNGVVPPQAYAALSFLLGKA